MNTVDLFGEVSQTKPQRLERHEHCVISGPNANRGVRITHSHEGGSEPHTHANTGPGSYTIDSDEWYATTGMRGGGKKEFTDGPTGEQLPVIPRDPEENSFEIHVGAPPPGWEGSGGGYAAACRMMLGMRMTVSNVIPFPGKPRREAR